MKKFFRHMVAAALIVGIVAGGMNPSTANAFSLGDIGKGIEKVGKEIGIDKIGKAKIDMSSIGKAIGLGDSNKVLDMEGLEGSQKRMLENLYYSTALIQVAYQNVKIATDDSIANKNAITAEQAARSAVKSSDAGLKMKNGAEQRKKESEGMKKYLSSALTSGDEEKLRQIDNLIKVANSERLISDTMAGVAGVQALKVVKAGLMKGLDPTNLSNLEPLIKTAKEAQALLKVRSDLSKALSTATKEYRKARGIKDPSKKEQKVAANQIEKG